MIDYTFLKIGGNGFMVSSDIKKLLRRFAWFENFICAKYYDMVYNDIKFYQVQTGSGYTIVIKRGALFHVLTKREYDIENRTDKPPAAPPPDPGISENLKRIYAYNRNGPENRIG